MNPGARINHYLLTKPLGKGGQGSVWEAFPVEGSSAPRALKLIDLRGVEKDKAERAWREAQAQHDVNHPGLVPCREFFRDSDSGLMGLVFDLVPGQTLSVAARDSRMAMEYKFAILDQLAAILAYVHGVGIVHRDLKPSNLLVTDAFWSSPHAPGGVKLVDFGISVRAGNPTPVTNPGSVVGTTPYLSPDLVCPGQWPFDREGFTRDVFAFGVLGWELIHGVHPTGLSPETLLPGYANAYREAHQQRRPWPPQSSNEPWIIALRACLALDPRQRPANGAAILDIVRTGHFAPATTTDIHNGPTVVHMPPTALPPGTSAGRTPHVPVAPQRSGSANTSGATRWLGLVMAAALGAFVFWLFAFPQKNLSSNNSSPLPSPTTNGLPMQPPNTLQTSTPETVPCCNNGKLCASGRDCNAGRCTDEALPERIWALRLTGVTDTVRHEDLAGSHPTATVCLRNDRTGETVCSDMTKIAVDGGDRINKLHASTSDLRYGRITIWVNDKGTTYLAATKIADNREGIKNSALCIGKLLRVAPLHVFAFLD